MTRAEPDNRREANLAAVKTAFAAVGAGDVDGQLAVYTDDVVMEMPFADPPARVEGKAAIRARLEPALRIFRFTLTVTDVYDCADPDTLVLEYESDGLVTTTGKEYHNRYVGIFRFRAGFICFHREYYNPVPAERALASD